MKVHFRPVNEKNLQEMKELLLAEGPNEWNYITDESIEQQLQLIREEKAYAILAEEDRIHGFAVLILKEASPDSLSKYDDLSSIAYINDVVVSSEQSGKGLGSKLLEKSIDLARQNRCCKVYIERHEENLASTGMMRKVGFEVVETFHDPIKRTSGSRKTCMLAKCI